MILLPNINSQQRLEQPSYGVVHNEEKRVFIEFFKSQTENIKKIGKKIQINKRINM